MTGYSSRDELFPPKTFTLTNTKEPRELTIKGIRRESFYDKKTGETKEKPALEFEETTAVWTLSPTAYDRLADQLNEADPRAWARRRVRIKLYPLAAAIYIDDKPIEMLVADAIDREEAEAEISKAKKPNGSDGGSSPPPSDDFSDSIPW